MEKLRGDSQQFTQDSGDLQVELGMLSKTAVKQMSMFDMNAAIAGNHIQERLSLAEIGFGQVGCGMKVVVPADVVEVTGSRGNEIMNILANGFKIGRQFGMRTLQ